MRHGLRFAFLWIGICGLIIGMPGCTKRVPLEAGSFEAQQKILVTFQDGRSVEGRVAPGNSVTYKDHQSVYLARVSSVTEDEIALEELMLVDRVDSYDLVRARLADARRQVEPSVEQVVLSRDEIGVVELLSFDPGRFAKVSVYCGYGALIALLLFLERS